MDCFIGIDPGKDGAIAVMDSDGRIFDVFDMPTIKNGSKRSLLVSELKRILAALVTEFGAQNIVCGIEKVNAFPGNGSVSSFSFGKNAGVLEGIVCGLGIRYELIHPKTWQKIALKDVEGSDTKARSVIAAGRMFPDLVLKRKKDHNRADAALIAAHIKKKNQSELDGIQCT